MSNPTAPTTPRSPWILGSASDLGLFVATPLLILPLYGVVRLGVRPESIALYVAAFGALGHHLPGMMRAYGDRKLFRRFRTRFVAAPLLLGVACIASAHWNLTVLSIVATVWGVWHGLMQTYGFARIYDGKKGSYSAATSWLDFLLCVAWFGTGFFLSPIRFQTLIDKYYVQCVGPLPPASWLAGFQDAWAIGTAVVTILFLFNLARMRMRGESVSYVKLLLLVSSFAFWWYTQVTIQNMLVGVALFEVFHDVQYLSIVWVFNRRRVDADPEVGGFTRFIFRRSGALVGVYVGMVFAYGSLALIGKGYSMTTIHGGFQGLLIGSGLLHFYYDGFIWKLREAPTRRPLGLADGAKQVHRGYSLPRWLAHGLKWAVFGIPAALLLRSELETPQGRLERKMWIAQALPTSAPAQVSSGEALMKAGRIDEAADAYAEALRLEAGSSAIHNNAGIVFAQQGKAAEAIEHFRRALVLDPDNADAHANLGLALGGQGELDLAMAHYREALNHYPDHKVAQDNLGIAIRLRNRERATAYNERGVVLAQEGRSAEAIAAFREALLLAPDDAGAHNNLGIVLAGLGRAEEAIQHYSRSIALEPDAPQTHVNLGVLLAARGKFDEAILRYREALRISPDNPDIHNSFGVVLAEQGMTDQAVARFRLALVLDPEHLPAKRNLDRWGSKAGRP